MVKLVPLDFDCRCINIDSFCLMTRKTATRSKSSGLVLFTYWPRRTTYYNSLSDLNWEVPEPAGAEGASD